MIREAHGRAFTKSRVRSKSLIRYCVGQFSWPFCGSTGKPEIWEREARLHAAAESDITTAFFPSTHNAQGSLTDYLSLASRHQVAESQCAAKFARSIVRAISLWLSLSKCLCSTCSLQERQLCSSFLGRPTHAELPEDDFVIHLSDDESGTVRFLLRVGMEDLGFRLSSFLGWVYESWVLRASERLRLSGESFGERP